MSPVLTTLIATARANNDDGDDVDDNNDNDDDDDDFTHIWPSPGN